MKTIRIAIVGGGLAGLTAAYLLKKMSGFLNVDVAVFEASNQLGSDLPLRQNFTVTDTEREILSLARELKVDMVPLTVDTPQKALCEFMQVLVREILCLKSKCIIEKSEDWATKNNDRLNKLDAISIVDYFVEKGKEANEVRTLLNASLLAVYADDFDQLSALDALRFMSQYIQCKTLYSMKEGIGALTRALVEVLNQDKPRIFLNRSVKRMAFKDDEWNLTFNDSSDESFDYVVMSDPQQYQKKNDTQYFKPGQRHLIAQMTVANNNGLFFSEEFVTTEAPSSMNSAVKSACNVVRYNLIPTIHATLPNMDAELTPAVEMAVFNSVNDSQVETTLS